MPQIEPKVDERDSWLEQIRTKVQTCNLRFHPFYFQIILVFKITLWFSQSFNLKPAVATRPRIQGPKTNMKLAAILEKANSIRQVSPPSFSVYYFWLPLLIYPFSSGSTNLDY
jgi:hypothetical protein